MYDTWESYFYPETYNPATGQGTLRNLFGERDAAALSLLEYAKTSSREFKLMRGVADVERTFDAEHLRAIHRYLFQDVFEWAGQYRSVNMSKNMSSFADVHSGEVDQYLDDVHRLVNQTSWAELNLDDFARASAEVFAYLNQAHPFREGNGRTAKVFMEHVAEQSQFTFDFARVSPHVWNQASMLSGPDLGTYEPVPDSLIPIFRHIAQPRTGGPRTTPSTPDATTTQLIRDKSARLEQMMNTRQQRQAPRPAPTRPPQPPRDDPPQRRGPSIH